MKTNETLQQLAETIEQRKSATADESYVASLYGAGLEKILDKISEEASETVAAAREEAPRNLIHEVADLWFHCMVLLAHKGLRYEDVLAELNNRFGTSGLAEKAQRN